MKFHQRCCCGKHCVKCMCPYSIRKKSVQGGAKDVDFLEEIDGVRWLN